jgi:hypothetical protein
MGDENIVNISLWKSQLGPFEKKILNYIYSCWKKDYHWPNYVLTTVKFDEEGNVPVTIQKLSNGIIDIDYGNKNDKRLKLTLLGIALCDGSDEDIKLFIKTIPVIIEIFKNDPLAENISSEKIKSKMKIDNNQINTLYHIINKSNLWNGFSHKDEMGNYNFSISVDILEYKNIKNFNEFYEKKYYGSIPDRFSPEKKFNPRYRTSEITVFPDNNYVEFDGEGLENDIEAFNGCFVLMPLNVKFNGIYKLIKKTVEGFGIECKRADEIFGPTVIIEDILKHIKNSSFLIADLTGRNPNVFYELGYAHAFQKDVILLTQDSTDVPFDLTHIRYIKYNNDIAGVEKLKDQLQKTIKELNSNSQ